jgi:hypothetical protein
MANKDVLWQGIYNIVDNAIKYTDADGYVLVTLEQKGGKVIITIRDTGVGISSEEIDKIFERFYRVDKARARSTGGTGLGLAIALAAIKYHDGEIDVKKLHHKLKMTNCGSVTLPLFNNNVFVSCKEKQRAVSFDIIAFRLPCEWDEGRGFDYQKDYIKDSHKIVSTDGSNWFQAKNGIDWDENGIYSYETLTKDYFENFNKNDDAIIIGKQHFDNGTENMELDITNYINQVLIDNKKFNGIGLAFSPNFEDITTD